MQKNLFLFIGLLAFGIMLNSCNKEENEENNNSSGTIIEKSITLNASSYDKWVYFSFKEGEVVEISDFSNSNEWDIAFHRMDVRINCGTSGPGSGGTSDLGAISFSSITEAPEIGYALNDSIDIMESSAMPPVYVTVPGDTVLSGKWVTYTHTESGAVYTVNDHVYVIKTADGKYVKIWLKDYYSEEGNGGYPTMKYAYQSDGSRQFN